nr:MAG TPA: hypothetical protein [Caudoviricetes sp.]
MRHSLLYLVVKESALIPRKREHVKHRCVPYWLRVYKCLGTSRFISLTPAAVKVQFLILVFGCITQLV